MNLNFLFHDDLVEKMQELIRPLIVNLSSHYRRTKGSIHSDELISTSKDTTSYDGKQ